MATTLANSFGRPVAVEGANGTTRNGDDPFTNTPTMQSSRPQRYSNFDTRLFADNHLSSSPSHAKRALESHLAETERRLQEASKLGTNLVDQRQKISARLREVELQQNQNELAPELRQRLRDIEKEYNEVGRESARAFLGPKTDPVGSASDSETPFALDGRKPASPAKFSSQATDSPSKVNVPRKQRNQPSSQIHDIEFAAEISTSLLSQVRQLQGMLSERDEALKATSLEKSRLEQEAEGFAQRLRSMDESEQRYKDENWNLEAQVQELTAEHKETASREHRVQQALAVATSEKNATLRELDDLKQTHGKAIEDHTLLRKNQDSELGSLRRDLIHGESERAALQRKIEELTSQNQELAKAFAGRFREDAPEQSGGVSPEPDMNPMDRSDTDHSPPPSPSKGSRRHSVLESETLKSSLHHAHRMIQNLKSNVHREKTEKLELKRMLQEARDELDMRRSEGPDHKRLKSKSHHDVAKKVVRPNMLGAGRNSRTDIAMDEPGWEDRSADNSPQPMRIRRMGFPDPAVTTDMSDAYQTANETEDGFETAQERDYPTDNDAFKAGTESIAGDSSDEMTETEGAVARGGTVRSKGPTLTSSKAEGRSSFSSTASTSAGEDANAFMTPNQPQPQKYRIKVNRGSRRSHLATKGIDSNPSTAKGSPASFIGVPGQGSQSLFAELGDINGTESGDDGTPSKTSTSQRSTPSMRRSVSSQGSSSRRRRSVSSQRSSQSIRPATGFYNGSEPPVPRIPVVDSGTMTEPWRPEQPVPESISQELPTHEAPSKAASPGEAQVFAEGTSPTPRSEGIKTPAASDRVFDSPSTAKSTPPRTVWDQPTYMFSNIIPTFGPASNTTPLSAKSTASRDITQNATPQSQRSGIGSSGFADNMSTGTPESQRRIMEKQDSKTDMPELSLSPIVGIATAPIQPPQLAMGTQVDYPGAQLGQNITQASQEFPFFSRTVSVESPPLQRMKSPDIQESAPLEHQTPEGNASSTVEPYSGRLNQGVTGRILGSIFGSGQSQQATAPQIAEDETSESTGMPTERDNSSRILRELPPSTTQRGPPKIYGYSEKLKPAAIDTTDHSAQTVLSSDQIERMLKQKETTDAVKPFSVPALKPLSAIGATSPPPSRQNFPDTLDFSKVKASEMTNKEAAPLGKGMKRPISSTSMRFSNSAENHPPLPPDHQKAIAAAAQRTSSTEPPNVMGPPLAPASAYKANPMRPRTPSRPRTPTDRVTIATPASRNSTTPRARHSATKSRVSRRSSVSSFESELDERFNIRSDGMPMPDGVDSGTDPRMIQAITQTMIGEFLWKYTRKAGRGEMSNNRHRRFFWVHPYTRTLYWSDRDPSTAGRAQMKAKSVAIVAVRVVTDDNPMPPGLHRKSLVVMTPGRSVKFTAQTSQRHETWFNALTYLLLRTGPEGSDNPYLTAEELAEFNPAYNNRSSSRTRGSRISLASFRSRGKTPEPGPDGRSQSRHSTRQPTGVPPASSLHYESDTSQQQGEKRSRRNSGSLGSRISAYWKPNRGMSVSSRTSQQSVGAGTTTSTSRPGHPANTGGVYRPTSSQAGSRQGSETDLSLRAGAVAGGKEKVLENVRSCCDGELFHVIRSSPFA
ncbi:MAG: hypothetical protein LQ343_003548 [Gyalolechia ehrenbergii]|nr:MAG: hypothetical protein LQ343_003548 [Gyalolechia ehrenbergii]